MMDLEDYLNAGTTTISNLLMTYYNKLGMTNQEFLLYLQLLHYQQEGNSFPDLQEISQRIGISNDDIFTVMENLLGKGFMQIKRIQDPQGRTGDSYDLSPIYVKIQQLLQSKIKKEAVVEHELGIQELFQMFEKEFGRPLSPMELETIKMWIVEDKYELEIIRLALRESVLNQVYNLKYVDRILLSWERKNLKSPVQIQQEQQKRKTELANQAPRQSEMSKEDLPKVPLYNWLNPDND